MNDPTSAFSLPGCACRRILVAEGVKWKGIERWGAVLGFVIFRGLGLFQDALRHHGPGRIWHEQPDRLEKASENQHKHHEYVGGGMLLAFSDWAYGLWSPKALKQAG
jgi:hypothetical protein